ncbi:LITAF domain-containing protein-like [Clarias gariepinus]|uniref:LITAF domain-containing protein-like n=1 Tax=Clarias gariepinus TaxID=13013 RepID=UPI00234CD460|nr:LITAF domain-containing protein-like [Clarias gariepinus]
MAYVINQPSAPVMVQPAPPTVIYEQPPAPVIVQPASPTVVVQPPSPVVVQPPMKSLPVSTKCNLCQHQVITVTRPVNGALTWTICLILFIFLIWPFCLIPFCSKTCRDIEHSCPLCRNIVHVHKRM